MQPDKYGWFETSIPLTNNIQPGWHIYQFEYEGSVIGRGVFFKPCKTQLGVISDIDDTYLISHSNNTLKKLSVMLFNNITQRKPFKDVVKHYQYLYNQSCQPNERNLFFNVTSSEWNLFPLIAQFSKYNKFPNAVILMDRLKFGWKELLLSGRGNHNHKYEKIEQIIQFYPDRKFILIGDDTQNDPWIYEKIYDQYREAILEIQIRQNGKQKKPKVDQIIQQIPNASYFKSSEDMLKSKRT